MTLGICEIFNAQVLNPHFVKTFASHSADLSDSRDGIIALSAKKHEKSDNRDSLASS